MTINMDILSNIIEEISFLDEEGQKNIELSLFMERMKTIIRREYPDISESEQNKIFLDRMIKIKELTELIDKYPKDVQEEWLRHVKKLRENHYPDEGKEYKIRLEIFEKCDKEKDDLIG